MIRKTKKCSAVSGFICACAVIAMAPVPSTAQATETVLHSFETLPAGGNPISAVIQDDAGSLYGTAFGGRYGAGVVYKLDTTGRETVLYAFMGGADGGTPSSVIRDSAGNLYGTTELGGSAGLGVVFKVDPAGHETVLYNLTSGTLNFPGNYPPAGVIRDAAGNLYGTLFQGGPVSQACLIGCGEVYKLDPAGQYSVLHSFTGGADGGNPSGGLVRDSAGNLYGTTANYGNFANGAVYKLDPAGLVTVLHAFNDGHLLSGLIGDSAGNFYGTATGIGAGVRDVVFKVDPSGQETDLYVFTGNGPDGRQPNGVIRDAAGNLYGTTVGGGAADGGVVYKLDPSGHQTVLHSFKGGSTDGTVPRSGVIGDGAGNLYGTTIGGGTSETGVVYMVDATGRETVLHSFFRGLDGLYPSAGVIGDSAGNLYGTTSQGGLAEAESGLGVVYKLDAQGRETVLHTFTGGTDGNGPNNVIRDAAGNLYGTTQSGGAANAGVVYKLDPAGNETVLYSFTGGADGGQPLAGVIRDEAGNLYGTTYSGGSAGFGVVYKLDPAGRETVLHTFTGGTDGNGPNDVIRDAAGNLYGTTRSGGAANAGVVYKLDPAGNETVLYSFTGGADGGQPLAGVVRDEAGNLYGTTYSGGHFGGVVYKLDPLGRETVLYTFTDGADGGGPYAGVIRDSAGNLYGTTYYFGASSPPQNGWGVVYKLDPAGQYSVLYSFKGGADGGSPRAGLIRDSAGNLYGTTAFGGRAKLGTVFKIKP